MIEQAVRKVLQYEAQLASGSKVYPAGMVPEATPTPYVAYQRIDGESFPTHQGSDGLRSALITLYFCGSGNGAFTEAQAESELARRVLDGYQGTVTLSNAVVSIDSSQMTGERADWLDDLKQYEIQQDYRILYSHQ